jgi:hypothetical protein
VDGVVKPIFAVCVVACTSSASEPAKVLPDDVYFMQDPTDFCGSGRPAVCELELSFCADGTYTLLLGDDGTVGTYRLDSDVAIDSSTGFMFDFALRRITEGPSWSAMPWTPATVVQDADVACSQ